MTEILKLAVQAGLRSAVLLDHYKKWDALCDTEQKEYLQLQRFADMIREDYRAELLGESVEAQPDDRGVHMAHCNVDDFLGSCKYDDSDCPALKAAQSVEPVAWIEVHDHGGGRESKRIVETEPVVKFPAIHRKYPLYTTRPDPTIPQN